MSSSSNPRVVLQSVKDFLTSLDLNFLKQRVLKENSDWSLTRFLTACDEYRKWLAICSLSRDIGVEQQIPLGMFSHDVDTIWHSHILFTRSYEAVCQSIAGHFIHHDPVQEEKSEASVLNSVDKHNTISLLEENFGPIHEIWVPQHSAPPCHGGCTTCGGGPPCTTSLLVERVNTAPPCHGGCTTCGSGPPCTTFLGQFEPLRVEMVANVSVFFPSYLQGVRREGITD